MPVNFKTIQRTQPGVKGGGVKKHYASVVYRGEATLEDLTRDIEKKSTMSGADIRGVLYATVDTARDRLANGEIVRLGDLGSLRLSINSRGEASPEEVTIGSINGAKVLFTPGPALKEMLKTLVFKKV